MTVSSTNTKNSYSGDASTTVFAYTFKIFDDDDISVILRTDATGVETVQTKGTHYSVSGVGNAGGGNITFVTAPASGVTVVLIRATVQTQTTDYTPNDPFPAASHEEALDRLTLMVQDQQEELDRSIKISRTNTISSSEFTIGAADRANKVFAFDGNGDFSVTQEIGIYKGTDATVTTSAYSARDIVKSTTAAQLDNVYIATQNSPAGTSLTNTTYWQLLIDAVTAATSAAAAASSATDAETAQTAAEAAQAAAETAETNAETAETNAETAETNAETAQAAAEAAQAAAETAEANAGTSETNAASSATASASSASASAASASAASTSETNASTSETNAASSASSASTSASTATTQAGIATTKAGEAATSATNAATSATNAATAQTAAESARDATLAAYDNFDDRYLGTKSSAPTLDNDGNALVAGALYFDSTAEAMYVYTGSAWVAAYVSGTGFLALTGGTMTGDINFGDNDKAIFGAGSDLQIYHDGSHSYIKDAGTGQLRILATDLRINNTANDKSYITGTDGAEISLYHNGSGKLATTATGVDVQGSVTADGLTVSASLASADLAYLNNTNATQSDVLRLNTAGVGIGTNILDVQSGDTTRFLVRGDGNVGIGTTTPTQPLSLYANNTSDTQLIIEQDSTGDAGIQFSLTGIKNWTVGVDNSDGDKFKIENGNTIGGSNDFVIDSSGNVGIGDTAPLDLLHIREAVNSATATQLLLQNEGSGNHAAGIAFQVSSSGETTGFAPKAGIVFERTSANGGGHLKFFNNSTNDTSPFSAADEVMRIDSSGNVGIAVIPSGSYKLEVAGSTYINGDLRTKSTYPIVDNVYDLGTASFRFNDANFGGTVTATAFSGDGSGLSNVGGNPPSVQVFTSSGTWTKPSGCKTIKVTVVGGGGGGGGARGLDGSSSAASGGGGAGGSAIEYIDVTAVSSVSVTVGSGGSGGNGVSNGSGGGTSSFGAYCTGNGGGGGDGHGTSNVEVGYGGSGGSSSGGDVNARGGNGHAGAIYGSANPASGAGGVSLFGGGGNRVTGNNNDGSAGSNGGGGSGAVTRNTVAERTGGAGGAGIVVVEEYY